MQVLLWLASVTRCASATLCPTDVDLIQAVKDENAARTTAIARRPDSDGTSLLVHFVDPDSVSDVICGESLPREPLSITCRFTVRYPGSDAYRMAKLAKNDSRWEIKEALQVTRERPRERQ
jgi:hypothetical protein